MYVEELGLIAAGVGGRGKSRMEEPKKSSARRTMPACAAFKSPYRGRLGTIYERVSIAGLQVERGP